MRYRADRGIIAAGRVGRPLVGRLPAYQKSKLFSHEVSGRLRPLDKRCPWCIDPASPKRRFRFTHAHLTGCVHPELEAFRASLKPPDITIFPEEIWEVLQRPPARWPAYVRLAERIAAGIP